MKHIIETPDGVYTHIASDELTGAEVYFSPLTGQSERFFVAQVSGFASAYCLATVPKNPQLTEIAIPYDVIIDSDGVVRNRDDQYLAGPLDFNAAPPFAKHAFFLASGQSSNAINRQHLIGKLKSITDRGFGFITPDNGEVDHFVHIAEFNPVRDKLPPPGTKLLFRSRARADKGMEAFDVKIYRGEA